MTPYVQALAALVWDARQERRMEKEPIVIARCLARAVAMDVEECPAYDPETDARVAWLRAVLAAQRVMPGKTPRAGADDEFRIRWLLGREQEAEMCGKARATGEDEWRVE